MANIFSRLAGLARGGMRAVTSRAAPGAVFTDLAPEDHQRLERHRALVLAAAQSVADLAAWTRTAADLDALQRVLDEGIFSRTQTRELQGVGVVFGDVLETELGLQWVAVMDEEGTEAVLRVRNTTVQVHVVKLVCQHVEEEANADLRGLMERVRASVTP